MRNPAWRPRFEDLLHFLFPRIQIHLDQDDLETHRQLKRQRDFARKLDDLSVSDIPGYEDVVFRVEDLDLF